MLCVMAPLALSRAHATHGGHLARDGEGRSSGGAGQASARAAETRYHATLFDRHRRLSDRRGSSAGAFASHFRRRWGRRPGLAHARGLGRPRREAALWSCARRRLTLRHARRAGPARRCFGAQSLTACAGTGRAAVAERLRSQREERGCFAPARMVGQRGARSPPGPPDRADTPTGSNGGARAPRSATASALIPPPPRDLDPLRVEDQPIFCSPRRGRDLQNWAISAARLGRAGAARRISTYTNARKRRATGGEGSSRPAIAGPDRDPKGR